MRRTLLILVFIFACASAWALDFPSLTGRVVDAAHILSSGTVQSLEQTLADYEARTTTQIVVATLPSLEGGTIEDYGYQLGRHWGIGQKGRDNGALLIVAPNERKVRIEVGYGLEGTLTDAVSNQIIQTIILPEFRHGHMESGVVQGVQAIIAVLSGNADQVLSAPAKQPFITIDPPNVKLLVDLLIIFLWVLFSFILPWWFPTWFRRGGIFFSSGGGGFGGGGGFSGGGGGFGGGGASGGW
ncbi:MAG: TPM domain-containing protein [Alphaproteobacteria bacterium]|nr:TPM domain-containing protein [Alphaproteobacteria bacterium]